MLIDSITIDFVTIVSVMANFSTKKHRIGELGLDKEDMKTFGGVLRVLNLDNIPQIASKIRQHGHHSTGNKPSQGLSGPCSINCKVINPPLHGSFHVVFAIEFADGVTWMLKIPAHGDRFDSVAAAALESEARTMQMLKKETKIPVPVVYAFDTSSKNDLSSPFIMMEKLDGKSLWHLWFNSDVPKAQLEHFRVKALQSVAAAMVQLNKFTLNIGGSLVFDSDGTPVGLGGAKAVDGVAIFNDANKRPAHEESCVEACDDSSKKGCIDGSDDYYVFQEHGPFSDPKAYFLSNLDRCDPAFRSDAYDRGTDMSLRLFIEWAFADLRNDARPFVLTHPDLDLQNIFVDDSGALTGLIDWDGVAAVPREVGCAQYPLWLMRDWVPYRYRYDTDKGKPCTGAGYNESSPAELASYRAFYAHFMEAEISKMTGGLNETTTFGTLPSHEAALTRRSLVMRSLDLAAGDPWVALGTVNHIIDQIEEVTNLEWEATDSDTDSMSSYSSVGDSESSISDCVTDDEDGEAKVLEPNKLGLLDGENDVISHQTRQDFEGAKCRVPEAFVKVEQISCGVAEQKQITSIPSEVFQTEVEQPQGQGTPGADIQNDSLKAVASPTWARRFLWFGCNTAENTLRRIAEIGYAPNIEIGKETQLSAEEEVQHTEPVVSGSYEHVLASNTSQQTFAEEVAQPSETKQHKNASSTRDARGTQQTSGTQTIELTADLQEVPSSEPIITPEQSGGSTSIPPTIEPQDIPLRKAELLQGVRMEKKAERKANYHADKAKIKKELKVWENIALAVWCRGVTFEQLQMNQGKIARWVVDTLQVENEHEDDLTANSHHPPAAETATAAVNTLDSSAAALRTLQGNSTQSKEEPENFGLEKDVPRSLKVESGHWSEISKANTAEAAVTHGPESKSHQNSLEKPFMKTREISAPENSPFDIYEDEDNEPESTIVTLSTAQPQARLRLARTSRTSKSNGRSRRAKILQAGKGGKASLVSGHKNPPLLESFFYTSSSNDPTSTKELEVQSDKSEIAAESYSRRTNMTHNEEAAKVLSKTTEVRPLSRYLSPCKNPALPAKAKHAHSFKALCRSGFSHITQIFINHNRSRKDKGCPAPESSVLSDGGEAEDGGSDFADARSSITSLSDPNEEVTEDTDGEPEVKGAAAAIARDDGAEDDKNPSEDEPKGDKMEEALGQTSRRAPIPSVQGLIEKNAGNEERCDNGTGNQTGCDNGAGNENGCDNGSGSENGCESGAGNEKGCENGADAETDGASSRGSAGPAEFEDHGGFDRYTVCNLLGMGQLDELRLLRLKEGFLKLLEQY